MGYYIALPIPLRRPMFGRRVTQGPEMGAGACREACVLEDGLSSFGGCVGSFGCYFLGI